MSKEIIGSGGGGAHTECSTCKKTVYIEFHHTQLTVAYPPGTGVARWAEHTVSDNHETTCHLSMQVIHYSLRDKHLGLSVSWDGTCPKIISGVVSIHPIQCPNCELSNRCYHTCEGMELSEDDERLKAFSAHGHFKTNRDCVLCDFVDSTHDKCGCSIREKKSRDMSFAEKAYIHRHEGTGAFIRHMLKPVHNELCAVFAKGHRLAGKDALTSDGLRMLSGADKSYDKVIWKKLDDGCMSFPDMHSKELLQLHRYITKRSKRVDDLQSMHKDGDVERMREVMFNGVVDDMHALRGLESSNPTLEEIKNGLNLTLEEIKNGLTESVEVERSIMHTLNNRSGPESIESEGVKPLNLPKLPRDWVIDARDDKIKRRSRVIDFNPDEPKRRTRNYVKILLEKGPRVDRNLGVVQGTSPEHNKLNSKRDQETSPEKNKSNVKRETFEYELARNADDMRLERQREFEEVVRRSQKMEEKTSETKRLCASCGTSMKSKLFHTVCVDGCDMQFHPRCFHRTDHRSLLEHCCFLCGDAIWLLDEFDGRSWKSHATKAFLDHMISVGEIEWDPDIGEQSQLVEDAEEDQQEGVEENQMGQGEGEQPERFYESTLPIYDNNPSVVPDTNRAVIPLDNKPVQCQQARRRRTRNRDRKCAAVNLVDLIREREKKVREVLSKTRLRASAKPFVIKMD